MSSTTALLVAGATFAFSIGVLCGDRQAARLPEVRRAVSSRLPVVRTAALLLTALSAVWLGAFIVQAVERYGLRSALVSSPDVRRAVGAGDFALTIKYLYATIGAAALSGVAAGLAESPRERRRWLSLAAAASSAAYFSTGRSTVVLGVVVAAVAFALSSGVQIRPLRLVAGAGAAAVMASVALLIGGALIGKTFANSEVATVDTIFTRHSSLEALALPYQYASAPVAALNELVAVTDRWGETDGCATLPPVCVVAAGAGLPVRPEPVIRAFTRAPLKWNTYTALDAPLLDGGRALALPIVGLLGLVVGGVWSIARRGFLAGLIGYPLVAVATLLSAVQNNFFAFHIAGAMLLSALAIATATHLRKAGSV